MRRLPLDVEGHDARFSGDSSRGLVLRGTVTAPVPFDTNRTTFREFPLPSGGCDVGNRAFMPRRADIDTILIIGAGPIIIGQACEFDYSGTQAVKALKAEGYRIVLVNSNPATIMTDPGLADATYIEPITPEIVARIIEHEKAERPDDKLVLLPTMGGQTALNTALTLNRLGILAKWDVEMIGAKAPVIDKAEDRELFREAMTRDRKSV